MTFDEFVKECGGVRLEKVARIIKEGKNKEVEVRMYALNATYNSTSTSTTTAVQTIAEKIEVAREIENYIING